MSKADYRYMDLVSDILLWGKSSKDRTGTGTLRLFGPQMEFDLSDGSLPVLTTKKIHLKSIIHELLWMISGSTNIKYLQENGVRIWNEWADENGDLGPVYGDQWRNFNGVDQLTNVVEQIKTNPNSRRHIVTAWDPEDVPNMALPPCHCFFQFFVWEDELSCKIYQRSADVGLGVPFNIVQYSLLTRMVAQVTGLKASKLIWSGGDVHIYTNHIDALKRQLDRVPRATPKLNLKDRGQDLFNFEYSDFEVVGYDPHPKIKMKVAV